MAETKILSSHQINKEQWDALVLKSPDGSLYCTYDYLSLCEGSWEAIVDESNETYQSAIPIPYRSKWKIKYIYQSPLQSYLTVLTSTGLDNKNLFIREALKKLLIYPYVAKYFLKENTLPLPNDFSVKEVHGFQIHLDRNYKEIYERYSNFRKRMLKKAARRNQYVVKSNDLGSFIQMHEKWTLPKIHSLVPQQKEVMRNLWQQLARNNQLEIYFSVSANAIVSGLLIGKFGKLIHALASFNTEEGRKIKSNTLLKDHVIKTYAQSQYQFFELGRTSAPGIDDFKISFGAENCSFYQLYRNNLPWYVKIPKAILNFFGFGIG